MAQHVKAPAQGVKQICVCGGGHEAHAIAAYLAYAHPDVRINVLTRSPEKWNLELKMRDGEGKLIGQGLLHLVSNKAEAVIPGSQVIIISLPAFAVQPVLEQIAPFVDNGAYLGSLPATGGFAWLAPRLVRGNVVFFGSMRVPFISRTVAYGKEAGILSKKPEGMQVVASPNEKTQTVCTMLSTLFDMPVQPINSFLEITLTPSNLILHTSRIYSLFHEYDPAHPESGLRSPPNMFYENWTVEASEIMVRCDRELQAVRAALPYDLHNVKNTLDHYGVPDAAALTKKISSIPAFRGIATPCVERVTLNGVFYCPDVAHRFFTEDILFGLLIAADIAQLVNVPVPSITELLRWAEKVMERSFFTEDGRLAVIRDSGMPSAAGIDSLDALRDCLL